MKAIPAQGPGAPAMVSQAPATSNAHDEDPLVEEE